jgi:hypothetical protein
MIVLLKASAFVRQFTLFALPVAVIVGLLPLIRWYGRDAYPIGLGYCLIMFFVLRFVGELVQPFFWP